MLQVGLAVGDIKAIQDEAELRSNLLQVGVYAFPCMRYICMHAFAWHAFAYVCVCVLCFFMIDWLLYLILTGEGLQPKGYSDRLPVNDYIHRHTHKHTHEQSISCGHWAVLMSMLGGCHFFFLTALEVNPCHVIALQALVFTHAARPPAPQWYVNAMYTQNSLSVFQLIYIQSFTYICVLFQCHISVCSHYA